MSLQEVSLIATTAMFVSVMGLALILWKALRGMHERDRTTKDLLDLLNLLDEHRKDLDAQLSELTMEEVE